MYLLAQMQVCPVFLNFVASVPRRAMSRSAELKMSSGAFPPSSRESFLREAAQSAMSSLPTAVEPVKESLATKALLVRTLLMAGVPLRLAGRTLNTPAGIPARSDSCWTGITQVT